MVNVLADGTRGGGPSTARGSPDAIVPNGALPCRGDIFALGASVYQSTGPHGTVACMTGEIPEPSAGVRRLREDANAVANLAAIVRHAPLVMTLQLRTNIGPPQPFRQVIHRRHQIRDGEATGDL